MTENDARRAFTPLDEFRLKGMYEEVQSLYAADSRPWIVGYSGGKDSTAALQIIWIALKELRESKRRKPIYVVSSDTLVENPLVLSRLHQSQDNMRKAAERDQLPITVELVHPAVSQTFWVNLIGRGYAAPTRNFRWCTDRLKIQPMNTYIRNRIAYHGEVIIVLGVRKGESATRDQVLSLRRTRLMHLYSHATFPGAYVYAPIQDFSIDDVWGYLLQQKSPWGDDNYSLLSLYRSAQDGECPLVVDKTTPSCGNSRFGCWVCTLVAVDRSMGNLIDSGEEWMEDLLEIRDFLYSTTNPEKKKMYRDYRRRSGQVSFKTDDPLTIARGPYYLHICQKILRDVLRVQKNLHDHGSDFKTITEPELHEIRRIWRTERGDWDDSVPKIHREVMGCDLDWGREDIVSFDASDESALREMCERQGVPVAMIKKVIDLEAMMQGTTRRNRVIESLDKVVSEEWRSEEELLQARREEEPA